jgi:branched-chain amino acid transport system ATP-binding protein
MSARAAPPVLRLTQVSRVFGGLRAVDRLSLDVADGERVAVIGPNGAGKTTLFNLVSGEVAPSEGRVEALGRDITRWPPHRRAALGLGRTYQLTNLFPRLTVLENLLLAAAALDGARRSMLRPIRRFAHLYERAEALLARLGLAEARDTPAWQLSYGAQRQLEIALALAGRPRLLLLDEPTAGLSSGETRDMLTVIRDLPRALTVVLQNGERIADGSPAAIRRDPRVQRIYLGTFA